jgi:glycosyltransferase involved in cell wall biosynthesis
MINKKIAFIIPFHTIWWWIKYIYELSNSLVELWIDVTIYCPILTFSQKKWRIQYILPQIYISLRNLINIWLPKRFLLNQKVNFLQSLILNKKKIETSWFDFIIATSWPTSYFVNSLNIKDKSKVYLIQSIETRSWNNIELALNSYKLDLFKICIAQWIYNEVQLIIKPNESYNLISNMILNPWINFDYFYPEKNDQPKEQYIFMLYWTKKIKWFAVWLEVFNNLKAQYPNLKLVLFWIKKWINIPNDDRIIFYKQPNIDLLRNLYNNATIFLSTSTHEWFHLPPLEAMACKTAVVWTNVWSIQELWIHWKNCMKAEVNNINEISNYITQLLNDENLRKWIAEEWYNLTRSMSRDGVASKFLKILFNS